MPAAVVQDPIEAVRPYEELRPELELLLASTRTTISQQTTGRIRALARGTMEWSYVLRAAEEHGVRPLLYRSFSTICPDIVPESVMEHLHSFVLANVARNMFLARELNRLLKGFKDHGISAIPFKGPVLSIMVHGDPSMREAGDLDIVVPERNLREAMGLLVTHGYRRRTPGLPETVTGVNQEDPGRYHIFDRNDSRATVDLQASLEAPHFSFPLDECLWDRAASQRFAGETVSIFCAEDTFILLCIHGTKDVWFKLKWICDIADFIERNKGIDWDLVLYQATRLHAKRKLLLGCFLAHSLLGANLPRNIVLAASKEPMVRASAGTIIKNLSASNRKFTGFERATLYLNTDDTWWDKIRRCLRYVFCYLSVAVVPSENDRRSLHLPNLFSSVGYFVRPVRLIAKYLMSPRLGVKVLREWFEAFD